MSTDRFVGTDTLVDLDRRLSENFPDPNPRYRIKGHLHEVMVQTGIGNVEGVLLELHRRLGAESKSRDFDASSTYPTEIQFVHNLGRSVVSEQKPLYSARDFPFITDVARYGKIDTNSLTDGGVLPTDYIYLLGKYMADRRAYDNLFSSGSVLFRQNATYDEITVGRDWTVKNGVYRVLALKGLGSQFITNTGMDKWIVARLER